VLYRQLDQDSIINVLYGSNPSTFRNGPQIETKWFINHIDNATMHTGHTMYVFVANFVAI
jgi:hypothetical protein